jgi:excisionase family DNA binding protein
MVNKYVSLNELAEYLGVSRKMLYRWAIDGKMPGYKVGRIWRFDRDEIDRSIKEGKLAASNCK